MAFFIVVATTHQAHAQNVISSIASFFGLGLLEFVNAVLAILFNSALKVMSLVLAIAGFLLNFSINLTLNIKTFVDSSSAIFNTWKAIRDISGIFIIFFLLYAAIQLILGIRSPKWGELIKNIVMAGILINFSFFFAGLGIDVSNIISVQLYNAIAPANPLNSSATTGGAASSITSTLKDGGISDIFMNSLQIQTLYNTANSQSSTLGTPGNSTNDPFKIVLIGTVGIIIEFTAAISFAAAALAFIGRFVVLILLLAFSPIWFLSFLPNVKEYTQKWIDAYKSMLIFMPVYLLLMYLAMNVLTTTPMFSAASVPTGSAWYVQYASMAVNAVIIIMLLNAPLVAAASVAGKTIPLLDKAVKNFGAGKIWSNVGGFAGTHTIGRAASKIDTALGKTRLGNTLLARDIRESTTGALAKSNMGGTRSHEERIKANKEVAKKASEINRGRAVNATLADVSAGRMAPTAPAFKDALRALPEKEKLLLGADKLKDPNVIRHLKKSDFEAIKKSDDFTEEDKAKIAEARKKTFEDAVRSGTAGLIQDMMKQYSGEDLLGIDNSLLDNSAIVPFYNTGQLKALDDASNDAGLKRRIGSSILAAATAPGGAHVATEGWIRKQRADFNTWM